MTKIEWADETWNPIVGCSVVSPGCTNCYAMRLAARLEKMGTEHYAGLTQPSKAGAVWTGKVALAPESVFMKPMGWRKPRRVFVNSMGALFHEGVPDDWIDRAFAVMALCPQHDFLVLTKRSARMRDYFANNAVRDAALRAQQPWPLPNIHLGVSAEDQARADERIPDLLDTPAAVRFVSAEPLLGPIDFTHINTIDTGWFNALGSSVLPNLDQIIVGGESGPGARPMYPGWARAIRDQCTAAGTAFFFKQWGAWRPGSDFTNRSSIPPICLDRTGRQVTAPARRGDFPEGATSADGWSWMRQVGKAAAGRLLDGREWNEFPEARP